MTLSAFISALIGGGCTLIGVLLAYKMSEKKRRNEQSDLIKGVLQGIHDEIETLWEIYSDRVGHIIESLQEGQGFEGYWVVTQDYFTVYTSNSHLIGQIPDVDLRKEIIATYSIAKSLIDSFRMNNELVLQFEQAVLLANETQNEKHQQVATLRRQQIVVYANSLKRIHGDLKVKVTSLLRELRKQGVLDEGQR
jgi:hypothetical protein